MKTYICLLRSVNVSGVNIIKMAELKTFWESLGYQDVKTYIQSGNIIFKSNQKLSEPILEKAIEEKFSTKNVSVIIKSPEELAEIINNNPFTKEEDFNPKFNYCCFLQRLPDAEKIAAFNQLTFGTDSFTIKGNVMYIKYAEGAGKTKLTNKVIESKLGVQSTSRNWNTTNKLLDLVK